MSKLRVNLGMSTPAETLFYLDVAKRAVDEVLLLGAAEGLVARSALPRSEYLSPAALDDILAVDEEEGSKGRAEGGRSYRETIVGTVALEPPTESVSKDLYSPWSVEGGDAELRRMSVKPSHRGRGISKLLFAALREHAKTKGFKRIVLSTSELQVLDCKLSDLCFSFSLSLLFLSVFPPLSLSL